jgi:hypothetical protein
MFRALAMWQRSNHSNRANQRRMADKNTHRLLGFTNEWWFTIILRVILMVIFHLSKFLWFGDRFCMALSVVDPEIPDTSSSISITECLDLKDHWVFFHRCPIRMVRIDPLGPPKFSETFLETQGPRRNRGLWMWGCYILEGITFGPILECWSLIYEGQIHQTRSSKWPIWIYLVWPEFEISWVSNST